jgi:hypothetical protein
MTRTRNMQQWVVCIKSICGRAEEKRNAIGIVMPERRNYTIDLSL